jgi:excisionase family DNA binding protein
VRGRDPELTIAEVAAQKRVTRRTVSRWINGGGLRAIVYSRRCVRVKLSDLIRFTRQKATASPYGLAG